MQKGESREALVRKLGKHRVISTDGTMLRENQTKWQCVLPF